MLKLLFKKQIRIELLIEDYLGALEQTQNNFREAMNSCIDDFVCHKFESKADDIRDEIKAMMYGNTLILDSRGDNQRHIIFIGLSFDKFWALPHIVYRTFSVLRFLFNYMNQKQRHKPFFQIKLNNIYK